MTTKAKIKVIKNQHLLNQLSKSMLMEKLSKKSNNKIAVNLNKKRKKSTSSKLSLNLTLKNSLFKPINLPKSHNKKRKHQAKKLKNKPTLKSQNQALRKVKLSKFCSTYQTW